MLLSSVTGGDFEREHLMPGEVIQQYELIRALGHGGMGSVYLARDVRLGRLVAIKFLAESSASVRARVMAEARTTASFNHDNIVTMYEVGEHDDRPYLVLEYIAGRTLRQWWRENTEEGFDSRGNELRTPLSPQRVASVMVPVVRALACAHDGGVIHRDLKAENVMLADSGAIKVLDFGIAKSFEAEPGAHGGDNIDNGPSRVPRALGHVNSGGIVGTLPYMSPEQLNSGEVDHRSDLWAAGIMMFEFALGQHPVPPSSLSFLYEIADLDEPMPSAARRDPRLGPLGAIIDRCLIKNRADRIDSAHTLLAELEALLPTRASSSSAAIDADRNPFAGLEPFQECDADCFFGRDRDTTALVTRVRSQPLVATVGPSGAGKSSLVRAGLVPTLERAVEGWTAHIIRPGRAPLSSLASLLSAVAHSSGGARANRAALGLTGDSGIDASASLQARLRAEPGAFGHGLRGWARRRLHRVLVFIDQFEELYTLGADADERAAFVACLAGAADDPSSPVRVVLSVREDFLGRMAEQREFMDLVSRGLMFVNPLDRAGLRQALTRPVEDADYAFEEAALVDDILDALADVTGALPLLQFAASALWQRRDRKRRLLTRAAYTAMGGIAGALAVHADTVLSALPKVEREQVREIFLRLITPDHTRAPAELSELCALPGDPKLTEDLVARLVDARLLVIDNGADGDGRSVEIVHEALIHGWPTLAGWLDETREDAIFRDRLRIAARQWDGSRRSEGLLWRGDAAVEAERWQRRGQRALPAHEHAYLNAVLALMRRARRARKLALGGGFTVLAALLVAAVATLLVVSEAKLEAVAQAALAEHSLSQERPASWSSPPCEPAARPSPS
ncbi:MAG: serine/threonine-protein kinase [Haliangiales bacterium]